MSNKSRYPNVPICEFCFGSGLEIDPTYPDEECGFCEGTGIEPPPSPPSNSMELADSEYSFNPEWQEMNKSFSCDCGHCVGMDTVWKKLCPEGKAAAKKKFAVYPSAYANGWAVQYCRGKFKGKKKK